MTDALIIRRARYRRSLNFHQPVNVRRGRRAAGGSPNTAEQSGAQHSKAQHGRAQRSKAKGRPAFGLVAQAFHQLVDVTASSGG
jgi:hypothetical protein